MSMLDSLFPPSENGDDAKTHAYVGFIALGLLAYLWAVKQGLGKRAL